VAVVADGAQWTLLNASPDLSRQLSSLPKLSPTGGVRDSAIEAVMFSDAELDHITGLLSLRETQPIRLYCTPQVFDWVFSSNVVFGALSSPEKFRVIEINDRKRAAIGRELEVEASFVDGKVPSYVKMKPANCDGAAVALKIIDRLTGSSLLHIPAVRKIDNRLIEAAAECDCMLFDGSFWSENEMELRGAGTRTASAMGHVPISGSNGSLARLSDLRVRKIYTHINNTNPILDEDSAERREVEKAGWEVAEDGMDFTV
jgi:pyrroloquinoline quinone biosynthesis protein B